MREMAGGGRAVIALIQRVTRGVMSAVMSAKRTRRRKSLRSSSGAVDCTVRDRYFEPGGGMSVLLMSRSTFHDPSACRFHTVRYLPLSSIDFPPLGVIDIV